MRMKEYQDDSSIHEIDGDSSDKEIRIATKKEERNLLGHKSRKPFLIILFGLCCLIILIAVVIVGENFKSDSTENTSGQEVTINEKNPEIKSFASSEAIQEGDLITTDNKEQERLNALAEESRVYCIISSAPYFQSIDSKGSLCISNPKESNYYTQVVIKTDDNEEMYVSPLLAPAEKIEYDYLTNKNFKQGSYHCFAYFNYYASEESSSYLGSMSAEINVEID